jgi:hypothetical protein
MDGGINKVGRGIHPPKSEQPVVTREQLETADLTKECGNRLQNLAKLMMESPFPQHSYSPKFKDPSGKEISKIAENNGILHRKATQKSRQH